MDNDDIVKAVVSSAAVPVAFPPSNWNNSTYSDGGLMHMVDIEGAIEHCIEKGFV